MIVKHQFLLLFLICLCGCSDNSEDQVSRSVQTEQWEVSQRKLQKWKKHFGLYIENGPRQGFQYFDSSKTEYNYRYFTITITNDSIIPVHLEIYFSKTAEILKGSCTSKVFLLPRHLTPEEQHFDHSISKELKSFLDREIDTQVRLNKTLKPTEKCVLTFGVLTDTKYSDPTTPFDTRLLVSNENLSVMSIKLQINDTLIVPCGQFSYIEK